MRRLVLTSLTAVALAGSAFTYNAFAAPGDAPDEPPVQLPDGPRVQGDGPRVQGNEPRLHGMEDRGFLFDAKLAGMKVALNLTPDQEKLWAPFELAVRDVAKARRAAMHEKMGGDERLSPIDRLNEMSDHLANASAHLKLVADAAKPLFDSLDETQKRHFGPLLMTLRPRHGGMSGGWHHHEDGGQ